MKRAHALREAGEVVFADATASVDRLNTATVPLLCSGPADALPLGVVFTSSQDEAHLTTGNSVLLCVLYTTMIALDARDERQFFGNLFDNIHTFIHHVVLP